MAEQLLRALGAKASEGLATGAVVKKPCRFLLTIPTKGKTAPTFGNASGLHDVNKVNAAQTVELLDLCGSIRSV